MVGTIAAAVSSGRVGRDALMWFIGAAGSCGALVGATLGASFGELGGSARWFLVGVSALLAVCVLAESAGMRGNRCWGLARQVRSTHFERLGPARAAAVWGAELGLGFTTRVNSWTFWAYLASVAVSGSYSLGAAAGLLYGLARGMQPIAAVIISTRVGQEEHVVASIPHSPRPRIVLSMAATGGVLAGVAGTALSIINRG